MGGLYIEGGQCKILKGCCSCLITVGSLVFLSAAFHKHLIPVAIAQQACRHGHRDQAGPRSSIEHRRRIGVQQVPAGA